MLMNHSSQIGGVLMIFWAHNYYDLRILLRLQPDGAGTSDHSTELVHGKMSLSSCMY